MSDDNGISWFKKAMQGTKPLKQKNKKYESKANTKAPLIITKRANKDNNNSLKFKESFLHEDEDKNNINIDSFYTGEIELSLSPECNIEYKQPSINNKIFKNIRQNNFILDDSIDLHGLNISESAILLRNFLYHAIQNNYRFIRIISGKGDKAILKNYVAHWLKDQKYILAFSTAPRSHGAKGAFIVYLKKL